MIEHIVQFFSTSQGVLVGIIGTVASIISVPLTLYLYIRQSPRRKFTYRVNMVRTQIVKAGESSRLSVRHDGQKLASDVTAAHIAIWNQGRKSIRQKDMLRPLVIQTEHHVPILEASVRKVTRDVIGLNLDEAECWQGQLKVLWNILEGRDGAIVQRIYAGSPDLPITVQAIAEGQRDVVAWSKFFAPQLRAKTLYWPGIIMLLTTSLHIAMVISRGRPLDLNIFLWVASIMYLLALWWRLRQLTPPFEF